MRPLTVRRLRLPQGRVAYVGATEDATSASATPTLEAALAGESDERLLAAVVRAERAGRAQLLAPVEPSKVVCVGLNYRRHAEEMGKPLPEEPLLFIKPSTAVVGPGAQIRIPQCSSEVHFEGELAVVIGARASDVSISDVADVIAGYTIMNDVTARDIQRHERHYTRAKGFDTFAPVGPVIATGLDPASLALETRVNGEVRQRSSCADLIFSVSELIAFITQVMTLLPGDIVSTGTPSGVGAIVAGDVVEVSIEGIGVLSNPVATK